jgi:enoyl-CoA hydratase/carnithine racemase
MNHAGLVLERAGELGHLVLDRPPRNAMDSALFAELRRLVAAELPSLGVRGLLVYGRGRHFSSGADVDEILARMDAQGRDDALATLRSNQEAVEALARSPIPVVAAISGCCFGSALELALGCHARVAASNALLALPEVQHGLMPGCGGTVRMVALVGHRRATELVLRGRSLDADEALSLGLVDRVVRREALVAEAARAVDDLARLRARG